MGDMVPMKVKNGVHTTYNNKTNDKILINLILLLNFENRLVVFFVLAKGFSTASFFKVF